MRAATIAALFGEGILVTLNATKLIMYWAIPRAFYQVIADGKMHRSTSLQIDGTLS